ncbi:MAG TPA: transposase [Tepidisphaeraceae bacterium]
MLNRSVTRIRLFRTAKDYTAFERTLEEALARTPVDLFTFCVMPTHWHLVLRPSAEGDLSRFMQWMTLAHAQRWRTSHGTVGYGPLYRGRFRAFAIQEDARL